MISSILSILSYKYQAEKRYRRVLIRKAANRDKEFIFKLKIITRRIWILPEDTGIGAKEKLIAGIAAGIIVYSDLWFFEREKKKQGIQEEKFSRS